MSDGPFPFSRQMMDLDAMLASIGGKGWDGLEAAFAPAQVHDRFDPGDDMKQMLAAFYNAAEGRKIIDWLADLTVRAPYPQVGNTLESAAIAAAKHEARFAVGRVLFQAIADGNAILDNERSQPK